MIWKIWKYALGSFADDKTRDYDNVVAIVRTIILFTYLITNVFIISGVIRHWIMTTTPNWQKHSKKPPKYKKKPRMIQAARKRTKTLIKKLTSQSS